MSMPSERMSLRIKFSNLPAMGMSATSLLHINGINHINGADIRRQIPARV